MKTINWHSESKAFCLTELNSSVNGLSTDEANKRLQQSGKNEIATTQKKNIFKRWLDQFNNILIYILIAAAIITSFLQYWVDSSVIIAVVFLNALIGFIQEGKAEKAIEALRKMLTLKAVVMRDGARSLMNAAELVPGDIVYLNTGDKVPADLRLLETNNLQVNEAILTGESLPIEKQTSPVEKSASLVDRTSMVYSGTLVTYGTAIGIIVTTGKETEIGRISTLLNGKSSFSTPLLRQIKSFGFWLALIILLFSLFIFLFGVFIRHYPLSEMFMVAVAIAVSVIPEGLPAIITITLAIGVTKMAKRHAIIRRLASVETLSSVTVICTDKTGTLTKNELSVQKIVCEGSKYDVSGSGYNNLGGLSLDHETVDLSKDTRLRMLIRAGVLCNDAELKKENNSWHLVGNPMDGALLALGLKVNMSHQHEIKQFPKTDAIPFDSSYKFMASLHHNYEGYSFIFVKGAPEKVLTMCSQSLDQNKSTTLDQAYWESQIEHLAENGMRVLALAYKKSHAEHMALSFSDVEKDLVFLGVVGIIDSPREEVKASVAECEQAHVRVIIITGDHSLTAKAIAKQVGIKSEKVLSGEDIDKLKDDELTQVVKDINIYARTVPEHKVRLVKALQHHNHVIAMTGDGVNDAPALHNADIGIAMGVKGTEVAKESSEIILTDDDFSTITHAVEEGRNIYNNIKKAILFVLPSNGGEGLSVFLAILLGYTLPISPVQILWVNLITAVTLALALAFEPHEKNLMLKPPRKPSEPLLSRFLVWRIGFVSIIYVCCMFGLFLYELKQGSDVSLARTVVVNVLVLLEVVYLLNCRKILGSVINKAGIFGSKVALIAIGVVILLQLGFTYLPFMHYVFKTHALDTSQWIIIISTCIVVFFIIEAEKAIMRRIRNLLIQ